jgi:PmbA protein
MDDLLEAAAAAVEMAKSSGATGARASASRSRSVETQFRDGAIERAQESTSRSVSLRVWIGRRSSAHSTNDLRPDSLGAFVAEAVAITRALEEDPFQDLPDPELYGGRPEIDLDLVDPATRTVDAAGREEWARASWEAARAHERVISATTFVSQGEERGALVASNGLSGTWEGTGLWGGAEVTVRDDGDARPEGSFAGGGTHRDALPDPVAAGRDALARATDRLGSTKGPTRRAIMLVEPRVAGSLLRRLLGPAHASAVSQSRSVYAGKVGQKLFSDRLTLHDDPLVRRGDGSRTFDGEGIAARPIPLVEAGVLRNLYVDTYYGRKTGLAPTTGGSSNLVIALGTRGRDALLAAAGDAILVTGWLGGNANATTGDFSLGVRGQLVEGGRLGAPIGEMNVTGNLVDLFAHLTEVGNDPWPYGSARIPTLVFEGVQFSGA